MKKIFFIIAVFCLCSSSFAQSNITLELKDAPVKTTLEMMFKQAGIKNYVIENSVTGFVTMNLSDQPFENSLKLVMRANTLPLTYAKENDVWIVKSRRIKIEIIAFKPSVVKYIFCRKSCISNFIRYFSSCYL